MSRYTVLSKPQIDTLITLQVIELLQGTAPDELPLGGTELFCIHKGDFLRRKFIFPLLRFLQIRRSTTLMRLGRFVVSMD